MPDTVRIPKVIGHRGAAAHAPENTRRSFRIARALGCRWVEFDVRLAAGGAFRPTAAPGTPSAAGSALARYSVREGNANWMPRSAKARSRPTFSRCWASM